ncbi:hypothetical protein GCM10027277_43750 [Pseudoduganella ginsengisoli]|uniref:Aromatic ring-opening dioxygenase LigA n=1 Tax=Pseudoduganella ginsengisoli TaxID=1462440 RepID=A0A6L6Q336_9BURK|nr:hypothetical protein [Pseudoduganella ginsengisoli]MTW03824.1 hypothetical protein [Pseudoduganella ginsengisoli]
MNNTIKLTFHNLSNDRNNSRIVIFQRNEQASLDDLGIAWKVIQNCGFDETHPFELPLNMQASVADSYGNFSPLVDVVPGQTLAYQTAPSGYRLLPVEPSPGGVVVQINNSLPQGVIHAGIYKNGTLLARKKNICPEDLALFEFKPTIWVGAASQIEQGDSMNSAVMNQTFKEFSLLGLRSATIVMQGGGGDRNALPLTFELTDRVMV